MNIRDAKEQIKNAMMAYFTKDEFGGYAIPIERQRPVFLMGPPGIGKTAIMEQIASEMGVGLLSYSMTHHTRQSALGLPFIEHKVYQGQEFDISEYTMSEIIASVYEMMENTGVKEGILFLDEINCVSETLSPIMLQFLQYKVFGRHRVPEGWIIVTAGNPPEYNNSVHEFDIVTWDRLKRIDIEPDLDAWKEYAYKAEVHPAVMTYLDIRKNNFYKIESTVDGKIFITARGWEDLSEMIRLYEKNKIKVDEKLIKQYVQYPKIAKDFAVYYDLFHKYRSDYQVDEIINGNASEQIKNRAKEAAFDERLALTGLILDALNQIMKKALMETDVLGLLAGELGTFRLEIMKNQAAPNAVLKERIDQNQDKLRKGMQSKSISTEEIYKQRQLMSYLEEISGLLEEETDGKQAFACAKSYFDKKIKNLKKIGSEGSKKLDNVFVFFEECFENGQEILVLVTELTASYYGAGFLSKYGSKKYFEHNKDLLVCDRQKEIESLLEEIEL